jgi:hypothetical protein
VKHTFINVLKAPTLKRVNSDSAIRYCAYGSSIVTNVSKESRHKRVNSDSSSSLADAETASGVTDSLTDDDPFEWMETSSTVTELDFDDEWQSSSFSSGVPSPEMEGVNTMNLDMRTAETRRAMELAQCGHQAAALEAQAKEAEARAQFARQEALELAHQAAALQLHDAEALAWLAQCKAQLRAIPPPLDYVQQAVWVPVLPPSACPLPAMSAYPTPLAMAEMKKAASPWVEGTDVASAHDTAVQHHQKTPTADATPTQAFTTLMLRNLPNSYTRDMLIELLDNEGFSGYYDLVYVPVDFMKLAGLGYAFVNFTANEAAEKATQAFQGFATWKNTSKKVCEVSWSGPLQGLSAHIEHYRNSPVMHESVPECYKPVLLQGGLPSPFPHPTKEIQTPRMKRRGFHHK